MSYDQWKTASPYDDEPDVLEEAEKWMLTAERNGIDKVNPDGKAWDADMHWRLQLASAYIIIKALSEYIEDYI